MKNFFFRVTLCLILCPGFLPRSIAIAQVDSLIKSEQASYQVRRYVIGASGIIGANSANHRHHATLGQTAVGRVQGSNHILLSGFWLGGSSAVGIQPDEPVALPTEFRLHQNYPNPFNTETVIRYDLPVAAWVTIEIFNTLGQRIRRLCSEMQGPGQAQVGWDGRDDQGQLMQSGIFIYRMMAHASAPKANQFEQTQKMILVK